MYKEKEIKKIFYSVGEVAELMNVNVSKIRFWEKKFNIIKPGRNKTGNRKFTKKDIEKIKLINQLLNEKKYTIKGAQQILKLKKEKTENEYDMIEKLKTIKSFLKKLKSNI